MRYEPIPIDIFAALAPYGLSKPDVAIPVNWPQCQEQGGIIIISGAQMMLIPIKNAAKAKHVYIPSPDGLSPYRTLRMYGLWHTHVKNTRPGKKDALLRKWCSSQRLPVLLVVTENRLFWL